MKPLRGLIILGEDAYRLVYGPDELRGIAQHVELLAPPQTRESIAAHKNLLSETDVIFSGWGGPVLDQAFLDSAPRLRGFFYGAGSLASILTSAVWERRPRLTITTALAANAVPVAEFTLANILYALKHGWRLSREMRQPRTAAPVDGRLVPGCYRSTVGLISLGTIARRLLALLKPFELNVLVYDPFVEPAEADALGVACVPLEEMFRRCDVISLHAPQLVETKGMITGKLLGSMKPGATFINTARPLIVRQDELIEVARQRPDLQFVLDVTDPEPLPADSPLRALENVIVTPHIAGSVGNECRRMGRFMVEELERFVAGRPLLGAVTPASIRHTSHIPWWTTPPIPSAEEADRLSGGPKVTVSLHVPRGGVAKV